jgi:hypothetical protein
MDTNYYTLTDGSTYALNVRKGRPNVDDRKRDADIVGERVQCVGCLRYCAADDTPGDEAEGTDAPAVAEADRPNGLPIIVRDEAGSVVKAPYSRATVPCCPSCNRKPKVRARFIDRIVAAHEARIREVGRRVG